MHLMKRKLEGGDEKGTTSRSFEKEEGRGRRGSSTPGGPVCERDETKKKGWA